MMKSKKYQVCAACIHFQSIRTVQRMTYHCKRLGFETKPDYSFECWTPTDTVMKLMEKRGDLPNDERT